MKNILSLLVIIMATLLIPACQKDKVDVTNYYYENDDLGILNKYLNIPSDPFKYDRNSPSQQSFHNSFALRDASLGTLGRALFYDKNLSADGKISCASCHLQSHAFSDTSALSTGIHGRQTFRNSLALGSVRSFTTSYGGGAGNFFWDDRVFSLEQQCIETFNNPDEMGITIKEVVQKTNSTEFYPILAKYTGTRGDIKHEMDSALVLNALSTFMNAMISSDSKFDQGLQLVGNVAPNLKFPNYTVQENLGKSLFIENCSTCHGTNFDRSLRPRANNGLSPKASDPGRFMVTKNEADRNVFKVPVLRNIALTAPYMHDGRFKTLEDVIDHYSEGIVYQDNLDFFLTKNVGGVKSAKQFNFSDEEKSALVAFLNTLTDEKLMHDPRFSDPFKY